MRVLLVGAGVIGTVYGSHLAADGHLFRCSRTARGPARWPEFAITRQGFAVTRTASATRVEVSVEAGQDLALVVRDNGTA
jgi:ketopantoate reductase